MTHQVPIPPAGPPRSWDALTLLAATIWGEARGEPPEGRVAVAGTIIERAFRGGWFGHGLTDVILRDTTGDGIPDQYSCWRPATMGGEVEKLMHPLDHDSEEAWVQCFRVACGVRFGWLATGMGDSTHYFSTTIAPPSWAAKLTHMGTIGRHRFYREDPVPPVRVMPEYI